MYSYYDYDSQWSSAEAGKYTGDAITDYGPEPFVVDIKKAVLNNETYRTALWTGDALQLTLMSIAAGEDIGLEMHPDVDQLLCVVCGQGRFEAGGGKNNMYTMQPVYEDSAIFVPAGTWHNVTNTGCTPLKLYSVYAPPEHPWGVIEQTRESALHE